MAIHFWAFMLLWVNVSFVISQEPISVTSATPEKGTNSSSRTITTTELSVTDRSVNEVDSNLLIREVNGQCQGVECEGLVKLMDGVVVRKRVNVSLEDTYDSTEIKDDGLKLLRRIEKFSKNHVMEINIPEFVNGTARAISKEIPRFAFGKNSFLTGFGLGFLAFGLKKLLLPLFIGVQIVKSVLIAMFLPSILGGIGKIVGKGVTNFASSSSGSSPSNTGGENINDFDFKDQTGGYDTEAAGSDHYGVWSYPPEGGHYAQGLTMLQSAIGRQPLPAYPSGSAGSSSSGSSLFGTGSGGFGSKYPERFQSKLPFPQPSTTKHQGSFYSKDKQQDYKLFHQIPSSSHLLANYDPFYSPLLSRLDSIFKQLGYSAENCRERLVCDMYSNPAKFAPFSNLVSAQLSRELNELRKPSSDNPEILRFFKYMKAAKEGQEGVDCVRRYPGCANPTLPNDAPPMLTTFNDINKLVHARNLQLS
ncbi:protein Osi24 [Lycorma delicatula]|uniref:protein Osi24 n=1 Tax=Lycorma delicatula TaxID=130591 RepID=UPI003F511CE4